jgi:outer membrane autotransporter protein
MTVIVNQTSTAISNSGKTLQIIQRFVSRRNDLLLSNDPDMSRQIDRLQQFSSASPSSAGTNFADGTAANGLGRPGSVLTPALGGGPATSAFAGAAPTGAGHDAMAQALGVQALGSSQPTDAAIWSGQAEALNRSDAGYGSAAPIPQSFSVSLSQMTRYAANAEQKQLDKKASALGLSPGALQAGSYKPSALDVWLEGHIAEFSDDRAGRVGDEDSFHVLYLGVDYVLSPSILVGAIVQYDSMRMRSTSDEIEGDGWMAGPYVTVKLSEHLYFQGRGAWGQSSNNVSPFLTYNDDFDSERWLVRGALQGEWQYGQVFLRPSASVAYIEDETDAYTDSLGAAIPSIDSSLGQARFGPEVAYRIVSSDGGMIEPRAKLEGIWNFADDTQSGTIVDTLVGLEEFRGRAELGLRMQTGQGMDGIALDLSAGYDGIGSDDYHAVEGRAAVRVPIN